MSTRFPLRRSACALLVVLWLATAGDARAQGSLATEGSLGAGAAVANLVYAPLKLAYAAGGLALSVVTYLWTWGDTEVAGRILSVALDGDYVVTPRNLDGDSDLMFSGD